MDFDAFDVFEQFLVKLEDVLVVMDMVVDDGHLAATYASADV